MMEPAITVTKTAFELWGPVGGLVLLVMLAGWMALRWLADRDDSRNTKVMEVIERVATIAGRFNTTVANNTAAMHEMKDASERMVTELGMIRDVVIPHRQGKTNGGRARA
jgi:hypothetical protein